MRECLNVTLMIKLFNKDNNSAKTLKILLIVPPKDRLWLIYLKKISNVARRSQFMFVSRRKNQELAL